MPTEDDRIKRIARALCRAERVDPDKPLAIGPGFSVSPDEPPVENQRPAAWTLYRDRAERFVAQNRDIVATL